MFDTLSAKLEAALEKVKGRGRLDEKTVDATLKEIRLALLEADVNFKVVRDVVGRLRERLVGEEVARALNPSQTVIKAVDAELTRALGGTSASLDLKGPAPSVVVLAGLRDRFARDGHGVTGRRGGVDVGADPLSVHLQLLDGGGTLQVARHQHRVPSPPLEVCGELPGGGRLPGALQPGEHDHLR